MSIFSIFSVFLSIDTIQCDPPFLYLACQALFRRIENMDVRIATDLPGEVASQLSGPAAYSVASLLLGRLREHLSEFSVLR
jgi:hypothetical protein